MSHFLDFFSWKILCVLIVTNRKCADVCAFDGPVTSSSPYRLFWREMSSFIGGCEGPQWLGGAVAVLAQGKALWCSFREASSAEFNIGEACRGPQWPGLWVFAVVVRAFGIFMLKSAGELLISFYPNGDVVVE